MNCLTQRPVSNQTIVHPKLTTIVVVHGWASNRLDMWLFCYRLRKLGYHVINWSYASIRKSIDNHAENLNRFLNEQQSRFRQHVHLVGHSMGGIVIRKVLNDSPPQKLSRVVLMASPNKGSHAARVFSKWLVRFSNTLAEISDESDSYVNQMAGLSDCDVGVLAASRDRVIIQENVHVVGEKDFFVVDSGHGIMPWKTAAAIQTHQFLMHGRFKRDRSEFL